LPGHRAYRIIVPRLPNISNFDDLDPLSAEPGVSVEFVAPGSPLPRDADLVLLPGSKATRADLAALRAQGWDVDILAHVRAGGRVLGLCGGYQILGRSVADPQGVEGPPGTSAGLGLLQIDTVLGGDKRLERIDARDDRSGGRLHGYEIHLGASDGADRSRPFLVLDGRNEGAVSADGRVAGCYLHGLFAADGWRAHFLESLGASADAALGYEVMVDRTLDRLADHLEATVDLDRLLAIARSR
jgi:adenosylcobyric acid synthase